MRKIVSLLGAVVLAVVWSVPVLAQYDYSAALLGTGHDEREDGGAGCLNETDFVVGVYDDVIQLQAGGNGYGCNSEWGAFAEFDFADLGESNVIVSASLTLRYTGYGDDAAGLPYIGVFGYSYGAGAVNLPRAELSDQTALAVFAPSSTTNVDYSFDVTELITELARDQIFRVGFFVGGIYSEVDYSDLVYFGGANHIHPPRLDITTERPVATERRSWGTVKVVYR